MMRLATKEDKKWHIDEWARLFKATTWEELKMIAEKDQVYSEAANSIYVQNSDETIRAMCEARQETIFHEQYMQKQLKEAQEEAIRHKQYVQKQLKELKERAKEDAISHKKQLSEKDAKLSEQSAQLSEQQNLIEQLQAELDSLKKNEG
ncbi:MAG: hypothetical protein E7279_11500 [Lachnospiraceae bacterium]|nr:hypothetical protein [Lachnospiraceae bacterium]